MKKMITKSAGETKDFAKEVAKTLKCGDVLALVEDFGFCFFTPPRFLISFPH